MTDKGLPGDDDERETLAGDTTAPIDKATQGDFDLESLPGKRPPRPQPPQTPAGTPPRRKLPEADDFFDVRPETAPQSFEPQATEALPGATESPRSSTELPAGATQVPPSTESPTREIDLEREMPTMAGTFAGSTAGSAPGRADDPDEAATIAEIPAGQSTGLPQLKGTLGTDQSGRKLPTAWKSPLSKAGSRTARDPIAGTAAMRGSHTGSRSGGASVLAEGQLLADRYELVERLGKGGMGEVWKAKHILLQGMRAIKVIKASISMDPSFRQRFLKEGQTMMRVKHSGVVEVTDLDETRANRELFMVMEYLKGRTIYDAVRDKEKPLADVREVVRILREVAEGMQRIHDERIVHKDLKSDNVLLVKGEDGFEHPKVIDFGLAKSLGDRDAAPEDGGTTSPAPYDSDLRTTLSGTLAYMAPEQFRGEPSSFQSDIFALGVMAYEMFTKGEYPLPRGPLLHYLDLHKRGASPELLAKKRPDLDPALTSILDRCMAPTREARPESCGQVAKDLQWWLDIPVRAELRRKRIYVASGAAAVAAILVWAVFFGGEKTASLSNLSVTSEATKITFDGKTAHVPAAALSSIVLAADIAGKPGDPVLELDGKARELTSEIRSGQLVVTVDLSDVADGVHPVALRASSSASPANFALDVDRKAPVVRTISVAGAVVTADGVFTSSDAPEVSVAVEEPPNRIAEVFAIATSGARSPGERPEGEGPWVIKGTAPGDGRTEFDVVVRDLAGNQARSKFAYLRDVRKPVLEVADVFDLPRESVPLGLHVRTPVRAAMTVTVDEPSQVSVAVGGRPAETRRVEARVPAEFPLPAIEDRVDAVVTATDVAGNAVERRFTVDVLPDVVRAMDVSNAATMVIRGDAPEWSADAGPKIILFRTYTLGDGVQLWSQRVRNADGSESRDEPRRALDLPVVTSADQGHTIVYGVPKGVLDDGVYAINATVAGDARPLPLELSVDSAPPQIVSVAVTLEDQRAVAEGGFALGQDLVVTAVVSDLSLEAVTLDSKPPSSSAAGRYVFRRRLDTEGGVTLTLVARDKAGHTSERAFTFTGDWSTPTLTLEAPVSGSQCDDVKPVVFSGRCSEPAYRLLVEGFPDRSTRSANCDAADFRQSFVFPPVTEPTQLTLTVTAIDLAGHRSQPVVVSLSEVHRGTDLPPEITWRHGVTALMEQVDPGDVVIGGRVQPVARVFVDRTEVTNADYRTFLAATKTAGGHGPWCHADEPKGWDHTPTAVTWNEPKWNADGLPVVNVAYWDAHAFAVWTKRRLPSEAEWVKAAAKSKLKGETELRKWPPFAPGEWRDGVLNTSECAKGIVLAAVSEDESPVHCLHMGGNVSEWVELADPAANSPAGTRGGSWYYSKAAADVKGTPAVAWNRSFRANTIGFRCAVDAAEVQP